MARTADYGKEHKRLRAMWKRRLESGELIICARRGCNLPILPGQLWDLGHDDVDRTRYAGPEHRKCNRRAGGRVGAAITKQIRRAKRRRLISSVW